MNYDPDKLPSTQAVVNVHARSELIWKKDPLAITPAMWDALNTLCMLCVVRDEDVRLAALGKVEIEK